MTQRPTVLAATVAGHGGGDLDVGREVHEQLTADHFGPSTRLRCWDGRVEEAVRDLRDQRPTTLILVGGAPRGRTPGTVHRRRVPPGYGSPSVMPSGGRSDADEAVAIDVVLERAAAEGLLPARTIMIELEPVTTGDGRSLSPDGDSAVPVLCHRARQDIARGPLFELTAQIERSLHGDRFEETPALQVLRELLGELERGDEHGAWGETFALRDHLRLRIADGLTGEGMSHRDWALWWALIEELDRLQRLDASSAAT